MAWIDALLLAATGVLAAIAALQLCALERDIAGAARGLRRSASLLLEIQELHRIQRRLAEAQRLAETVVDSGTAAVRAVHFGIASVPFDLLEKVPVARDATRVVRQAHNLIADAVYGAIRGANRVLGETTRKAAKTAPPPGSTPRRD